VLYVGCFFDDLLVGLVGVDFFDVVGYVIVVLYLCLFD